MSDGTSRLERAKYTGRETTTVVLECDKASVRRAPDGGLVVELFRYGRDDKAVEGYQLHLCAADCTRFERALARPHN